MAKADRVSLTFEADLGPLIKKLREVEDLTGAEVRKATSALRRGVKELNKDAANVKRASATAAGGVKDLGERSGDAESSLRAVAGVIGLVSPQAETALASIAELGGGLEGVTRATELFGGSMGSVLRIAAPVGVAVAALGVAHHLASKQVEAAEKAMERAAETAERAQRVYGKTGDLVNDLEKEFRVLSGELSEQAQSLQDQQKQIAARFRVSRNAMLRQIGTLEQQKEAIKRSSSSAQEMTAQLDKVNEKIAFQRALITGMNKQERRALFLAEANSELREAESSQRDKVTSSTNAQTAALSALSTAQARVEQEAEDAMRSVSHELDLRDKLADLLQTAQPRTNEERQIDKVNEKLRERLLVLREIEFFLGKSAQTEQARHGLIVAQQEEIATIRQEGEEQYQELAQQTHDVLTRLITSQEMQRRQSLQNMGSALGTFAAGVADATRVAAEKMAETNVEGARRMFIASQAAAIANTVIQGAMAAVGALAPPPFGLGVIGGSIAAAGIAATTAANVAIIASQKPSFNDTPGIMQLPSGGGVTLAPGDYMMAAKDLNDMQKQLDRATGQERRPVVQVVAIPSYQGRTYERARRDAYRRPGSDYDRLAAGPRGGAGGW